jgi:hypothetical protein
LDFPSRRVKQISRLFLEDKSMKRIGSLTPLLIDPSGTTITGIYIDSGGVNHGFVRATDGAITEFSAKGAGTKIGQGTFTAGVDGINHAGAIPGTYANSAGVFHSFVRSAKGAITKFTVSGAGTGSGQGVIVSGINTGGEVAGVYIDSAGADHGYVLASAKVTKFNAPGAGTGSVQGTEPENINTAGDSTGQYIDSSGVNHGFLRVADGSIINSTFLAQAQLAAKARSRAATTTRTRSQELTLIQEECFMGSR